MKITCREIKKKSPNMQYFLNFCQTPGAANLNQLTFKNRIRKIKCDYAVDNRSSLREHLFCLYGKNARWRQYFSVNRNWMEKS
jgi:hypothetical protein